MITEHCLPNAKYFPDTWEISNQNDQAVTFRKIVGKVLLTLELGHPSSPISIRLTQIQLVHGTLLRNLFINSQIQSQHINKQCLTNRLIAAIS